MAVILAGIELPGVQNIRTEEELHQREVIIKILHASAVHDRCGLYRFLTRNRLVASISHENLPSGITAGFLDGTPQIA